MEDRKKLLISNIPFECPDEFVKDWIEARGYRTYGVRLIRDTVSGTSPSFAYVQLMEPSRLDEAARALDGQTLWGVTVEARRVVPLSSVRRSVAFKRLQPR